MNYSIFLDVSGVLFESPQNFELNQGMGGNFDDAMNCTKGRCGVGGGVPKQKKEKTQENKKT